MPNLFEIKFFKSKDSKSPTPQILLIYLSIKTLKLLEDATPDFYGILLVDDFYEILSRYMIIQ